MRASDRDRERAVALLRARCVEGYLSVDTFEYRLGRVLAARSLAELRVLVADVARRRWTWPRRRAVRSARCAPVALPARGTIVVGRSRGCDVVMPQATVSCSATARSCSRPPGAEGPQVRRRSASPLGVRE